MRKIPGHPSHQCFGLMVFRPRSVPALGGEGFILDPLGEWRPLVDDGLYAIEAECVAIHSDLAGTLFGTIARFHALLPLVPPILSEAGLNSEAPLSRQDFEMLLSKLAAFPELNRWLYLYDCRTLVSAIQECTKEVCLLTGEFYRT